MKIEPLDVSTSVTTEPAEPQKPRKPDPGQRASSGRQRRVRKTDFLKFPLMTLSKSGKINFSEELRKQTGLVKEEKMKKKRKKELDQLTKEALRILIEDEKERAMEEKLEKDRLKAEEKRAKKKTKSGKKAIPVTPGTTPALKTRPARARKVPVKSEPREKSVKKEKNKSEKSSSAEIAVKPDPETGKGKRGRKKGKPGRKGSNPTTAPVMPPPEPPAPPAPVLGCVTFRSGDKIIRRSPRKLPEAAVNAVNPKTGLVPYAFAALLGNTQGVIPVGLTEKHFVSYRKGFYLML